ncbi:hypothetical protein [Sphingobium lignivorans]|uniref:LPXTG-motif cell wall anchor domain-containing protein n=1 Tax=Sphingobium lignivorans TaxID=2735886 RepID=A0ABR6NKG7_9SPHN|nr:hypothetical protein [Sphingobium lignivorans]MBB5987769.1 hypothetical protein [Sphingobium lignivorans]
MKNHTPLIRPAPTAIAAALALLSTTGVAQVAAPVSEPAPSDAAPQTGAPSIVVPRAESSQPIPLPQTTLPPVTNNAPTTNAPATSAPPPVATTAAPAPSMSSTAPVAAPPLPAVNAPAPEARQAPAAPRAETPASTARSGEGTQRSASAPAAEAPRESTPTQEAAQTQEAPAPLAATVAPDVPNETVVPQGAGESPAAIETMAATPQQAESDETAYWALGAAGAVLVLGAGGLVMLRRRKRGEDAIAPAYVPARDHVAPTSAHEPVVVTQADAVPVSPVAPAARPVEPAAMSATASATAPAPAAARAASPARDFKGDSALEAMVAEAPSAENPFRTRRQRLRRASFLLRQGTPPVASTQEPHRPAQVTPAPAPAAEPARQPVYSFGAPVASPSRGWKPART